ncbi:MAG: hypothetical protein HBSAPP03_00990 [Phycisphaerae bacterium]|nr:MAG: hypothetical protein HBSAPP03_00990 [Phycisphaerae bacterium]
MLRSILAVIVSYIVMAILVIGAFMAMWYGLGPDGLLQPGSYKGNMLISIAAPTIAGVGGLFGGWLCAKIGRGRGPVAALAAVVLVLGLTMAYFTLQKPYPADPRPAGMTVKEIMEVGREPTWVAISNPILGAITVFLGGLCVCKTKNPA